MKKVNIKDRKFIENHPLPDYGKDSKYAVVKHTMAIDLVEKYLNQNNLYVNSEKYLIDNGGDLMYAWLKLSNEVSDTFQPIVLIRNSYDKSRRFGVFAGIAHKDTNNLMILGNSIYGSYQRKHIGTANSDIKMHINEICKNLVKDQATLLEQKQKLTSREIKMSTVIAMLANMRIYDNIITPTQFNWISKQLKDREKVTHMNGFKFYMLCASALQEHGKSCDKYFSAHSKLNTYICEQLHIITTGDQVKIKFEWNN